MNDSVAAPGGSPRLWPRLRHNRAAMAALCMLTLVAGACFAGPWLMDAGRNSPSSAVFSPPVSRESLSGFTALCGTDGNGRDLLYRILAGGRVSLVIAVCATAVSLIAGTAAGLIAGFYGGKVDAFIMRTIDVLYALPRVLLALVMIAALDEPVRAWLGDWLTRADLAGQSAVKDVLAALLPYSKSLILVLCLGMIEWLTLARIVRGQVLRLKAQAFVEAARCLGNSRTRIMFRHLLPNLWPVILTCLTLTVPSVILDESLLSFLGLGIEEPAASWGLLLGHGAAAVNPLELHWWLLLFPALAMTATLLALNFLGDSLRDALDVH